LKNVVLKKVYIGVSVGYMAYLHIENMRKVRLVVLTGGYQIYLSAVLTAVKVAGRKTVVIAAITPMAALSFVAASAIRL